MDEVKLQLKKAPETGGKERIHFTLKGAGNISNKTTIWKRGLVVTVHKTQQL